MELNGQVLNGHPYNRKCDVYSFGICLWEIYCCDMPYPHLSFSELTSAVVHQVSFYLCFSWLLLFRDLTLWNELAEFTARDTSMLPEFSCKRNETMLGCECWYEEARNGWGCLHVRSDWYIKGRGYDSSQSISRLFLFPHTSGALAKHHNFSNLYSIYLFTIIIIIILYI